MPEVRRRPLLLLIARDAATLEVINATLREDFEIYTTTNSSSALALTSRLLPDAIILDADDEEDAALLAQIRTLPAGTDTPILVLTSSADATTYERLTRIGATDFVAKPVYAPRLLNRLHFQLRSSNELKNARDSAERLARAQRLARFAWWELVVDTGRFRWSDEVTSIFGISPEDDAGGIAALLQWVHPDDRLMVANSMLDPIPHRIEYRLLLPDGRRRIIHQEADVVLDDTQTPIQVIGAAQDVTELRDAERHIHELAYFDSLTGLPNRSLLRLFLDRVAGDRRRSRGMSVLALDLDGFKRVNDTLGHAAGDALLVEVGRRLQGSLRGAQRQLDTIDKFEDQLDRDVLVARLGGDEFVIVLTNVRQPDESIYVARRIGEVLSETFHISRTEVFISSSIGIASVTPGQTTGENLTTLLEQADTALYHAKEKGRNNYQVFNPTLLERARRRMAVENSMRTALMRGADASFRLVFQPKVEIPSERMVGAEALLRWTSPELGEVSPAEFIPVAEDAGLIVQLGSWVLRTACEAAVEWAMTQNGPLKVAVNVSSRQFRESDFALEVARVLEETGLPATLLELEITETILMSDGVASAKMLEALKQLGVSIALDDFGTGYSSLGYLTKLPIDALKIDRSFVRGLGTEEKSATVTSAIIGLSRGLGIDVIVEGVETKSQLEFIERHGTAVIQGYLFAKPMPLADLAIWARESDARRLQTEESGVFFTRPMLPSNVRPLRPTTMHLPTGGRERRR